MPFRILLPLLFAWILCGASLEATTLPDKGPVPADKPLAAPEQSKQAEPETDGKTPVKADMPVRPDPSQGAATEGKQAADAATPASNSKEVEIREKPAEAPTIEPEPAAGYASCLADLKRLGATFRAEKRIDDGKGCGIDKPLVINTVLPGITLSPAGTMRCETARKLARWTKEAVLPAAAAALETEGPITSINQASSYVCRLRNNAATGKISEHARGNAVDIASFTFKSGKTIAIEPRDEDGTLNGAFQRAVTASGCLYFATVLDPGSDEAHENHLHFDVLERKNGYRYCR